MSRQTLLALIVWAINTDGLSLSITKAWEMFQRDAWKCYKTFTDPNTDDYCPNLVGKDPVDVMTDYVLFYAKMHVVSGIKDFGKYNKDILNYKRL